jgi:hypothetical protein
MFSEQITWWQPMERLPDDETTVLLRMPDTLNDPVALGYHVGEAWFLENGAPAGRVLAWAHLPTGD